MKQATISFRYVVLMSFLAMIFLANLVRSQDLESLFQETQLTIEAADKVNAAVLSPKNYEEGQKHYSQAQSDYDKGKKIDDIRKKLRAASSYYKKAIHGTRLAEVTFVSSIKARSDAIAANASGFAEDQWKRAEEKFYEAARKLEDGNVKDARKKAAEAEELYRAVELDAIKATYLNETRELLEQARKNKVKDRAPKTLAKSEELVLMAEKELDENRYDRDVARSLAQQAKYEAKHSIYLAHTIRIMKDDDETIEELLLKSEEPLKDIAHHINVLAEFDQGYEPTRDQIVSFIQNLEDKVARLEQELTQIPNLKARIDELEGQLGDVAQEKTALQERIEAQQQVRAQFASVEKMFAREEARVLREGEDVILRLVGLNFAVGKAEIQPQYFSLLSKVREAINTFPECTITVQGHTDSHGSDTQNLTLSQERSDAVREYLLANMPGLSSNNINSVGYGESKPIANNTTKEGRTKNRRIDLVIHPHLVEIE